MVIRQAESNDFNEIYELVKTAFQTAKVSDGTEQDFVYELRKREYIQQLELVAEEDDQMIGHVMFTGIKVKTEKDDYKALLLAPLSVKLENRNMRVGEQLIKRGFEKAKALGYGAVFLVGDPAYYGRVGFKRVGEFDIKNASEIPDEFVLGCEIVKGALDNVYGEVNIQ